MNFLEKAGLLMFLSGLVSISHLEPSPSGTTRAIALLVLGGFLFIIGNK